MGGVGPLVKSLTAEYMPAQGSQNCHTKATTAVNTAQRLGALTTIPQFTDDLRLLNGPPNEPSTRPPWHLIIQNPIGNAAPVYLTWDNNTVPVAGGPGYELAPGAGAKFEHVEALLTPHSHDTYQVNANSAIQIISLTAQALLFHFSD